jgi:hypothetical protein
LTLPLLLLLFSLSLSFILVLLFVFFFSHSPPSLFRVETQAAGLLLHLVRIFGPEQFLQRMEEASDPNIRRAVTSAKIRLAAKYPNFKLACEMY